MQRILLIAVTAAALQMPANAATTVVSPADQAARDNDRLRILDDELASETSALENLTRRRADRLAAGDAAGVADAEQALHRGASNVAALRREIAGVQRVPGTAAAPRPMPADVHATKHPAPAAATPPWWDVYRRAPRDAAALSTTGQALSGPSNVNTGAVQ